MTSLDSMLEVLKRLSKHSKFLIETRIPVLEKWEHWKPSYHKMFLKCSGIAYCEGCIVEGIEPGKTSLVVWGSRRRPTSSSSSSCATRLR